MAPAPLIVMVRPMNDWIEHRREDGELVGWIRSCGEGFVAVDVLGREVTAEVDGLPGGEAWENGARSSLRQRGVWGLQVGTAQRVGSPAVGAEAIRVREDDFAAAAVVGAPVRDHVLPFPAPPALRRAAK